MADCHFVTCGHHEAAAQRPTSYASGFGGTVEASFSEGLAEVRNQAEESELPSLEIAPQTKRGDAVEQNEYDQLLRLAESFPRAAVLQSWLLIEDEVRRLTHSPAATDRAVRSLAESLSVPGDLASMINQLRILRNVAAHSGVEAVIPSATAREYLDTVLRVMSALRKIS